MGDVGSELPQLDPAMKLQLKVAGASIRSAQDGERLDRTTLETLYRAFKTVAAYCTEKAADGGPLLDRKMFGLIVVEVVGNVEKRVIDKLFRAVDDDGSGYVDFGEFVGSARMLTADMAAQKEELPPEVDSAVRTAFSLVDEELLGRISLTQGFERVLRLLSLEVEEFPLVLRLKTYAEATEFLEPDQEVIDDLFLKRYENVAKAEAKDGIRQKHSEPVHAEAEKLGARLKINIDQMVSLVVPHQREIESMVPLLEQAFNTFDRDSSGTIDAVELRVVMRALGQKDSESEVMDIMRTVDLDGSGEISFAEFVRFMGDRGGEDAKRYRLQAQISAMCALFSVVDKQRVGIFELDDLDEAMKLVRCNEPRHVLKASFQRAGGEGDLGCFLNMMCDPDVPRGVKQFIRRLRSLREIFQLFDANDSGAISVAELSTGLTKYLGWRPTRFEADKMLELVDKSGNGSIDLAEFVEMLSVQGNSYTKSLVEIKKELRTLQDLFTMFDMNGDGVLDFQINEDHMRKVVNCLGTVWPEERIKSMCNEMSKGAPASSFRDFCEFFINDASENCKMLRAHFDQLKQLFHQWDGDGSGEIDAEELTRILGLLGRYKGSGDEVRKLVDSADTDGDGEISLVEFVILLAGRGTQTQQFVNQQMVQLKASFDMFDKDSSGAVAPEEFARLACLFGMTDKDVIEEMLGSNDSDGNGEIDFIEFVGMMTCNTSAAQTEMRGHLAGFREAFNLFDADGTGMITEARFFDAVRVLGFGMSREQVHEMVVEYDADGNGQLDFPEFVDMLTASSVLMGGSKNANQDIAQEIAKLRESFSLFDADGDGVLSFGEIKKALISLGAHITDNELKEMIVQADTNFDGTLSFPEFVVMMSLCKTEEEEEEDERGAKEADTSLEPMIEALRRPPEERLDRDIDLILHRVREVLNVRAMREMDHDIARDVCRTMMLQTFKTGEVLLKENAELYKFWIILSGEVQVWKQDGEQALKCGGGLWSVAQNLFQSLEERLKQIKGNLPGGSITDYSQPTWNMVTDIDALIVFAHTLLCQGTECMKDDLDLVMREQDIHPKFGEDGQRLIRAMRSTLGGAETVRKEYLGHVTHMQISGQSDTLKGQRVRIIADLVVELQLLLGEMIDALEPVYQVDEETHWFKKLLATEEKKDGHLAATLGPGYTIGNSIFRGEMQKCPATCTCLVPDVVTRVDKKKSETKGWGSMKGIEFEQAAGTMDLILVSRRNFLMARSAEPMRFIKTLPYFSDSLKDAQLLQVAEHMTLRSLAMNSYLLRRGQPATSVYLVKAGQLKILLQAGSDPARDTGNESGNSTYLVRGRHDVFDAAIIGAGDVVEELETAPDGTSTYSADIVAASSGVVVYALPVAVFHKFASWREVSKHRSALRETFIGDQSQLKPVQRLDGNQLAAMRSRRIVMQLKKAPVRAETYAVKARAIMAARQRSVSVPVDMSYPAPVRVNKEADSPASCSFPQIPGADPGCAAPPPHGYSVAARSLSRKGQRKPMYRGLEIQLRNQHLRAIVDQDCERIKGEAAHRGAAAERKRKKMLRKLYEPPDPTQEVKPRVKLPVLVQGCERDLKMLALRSKFGMEEQQRPTTYIPTKYRQTMPRV